MSKIILIGNPGIGTARFLSAAMLHHIDVVIVDDVENHMNKAFEKPAILFTNRPDAIELIKPAVKPCTGRHTYEPAETIKISENMTKQVYRCRCGKTI